MVYGKTKTYGDVKLVMHHAKLVKVLVQTNVLHALMELSLLEQNVLKYVQMENGLILKKTYAKTVMATVKPVLDLVKINVLLVEHTDIY